MEETGSPAHSPKVSMYTAAYCGYCTRAERLLESKGVADIVKLRVDEDPALRSEMMQRTGRRTVPQIYIGDFHVGGYDDLAALDRAGRLDPLLAGERP
ncbi:MAG: glutaredoxin 3 [Candidatus Levyibacteriota bacterium]